MAFVYIQKERKSTCHSTDDLSLTHNLYILVYYAEEKKTCLSSIHINKSHFFYFNNIKKKE